MNDVKLNGTYSIYNNCPLPLKVVKEKSPIKIIIKFYLIRVSIDFKFDHKSSIY